MIKLEEKKIEEKVFKKALNYLSIYISSTKKLTIILEKFTKNKFPKLDKIKKNQIIQNCLKKCIDLGYLDDEKFIEYHYDKERKKGASKNKILSKLYCAGVNYDFANKVITKKETSLEADYLDNELAACIIYIKKKKLGTFNKNFNQELLIKDYKKLSRAGFSKFISEKVLNIKCEDEAYEFLNKNKYFEKDSLFINDKNV